MKTAIIYVQLHAAVYSVALFYDSKVDYIDLELPLSFSTGQHGGARVFKTLQNLVLSLDAAKITIGVVVTEDGSWESRHLKKCTLEKKIPIMVSSLIF